MVQEEVRNYEISVWSLQDDFITVLKMANIQRKGQTENGELKLNVDGTQELSFSIPMYIYDGIERIENPTWYSYKHGALIANMRKIKVILNKNTEYEDIFEFLIIKVTEKHDKGELYCEVECEGLAFHELGKTGYKISLSPDDFEEEYEEWFESDQSGSEPQQNIQYWLNKFMEPYPEDEEFIDAATWYYSIEMDWSAYTQFNGSEIIPRYSNIIYEDEYVASWETNETDDILRPHQVETYKEKWRPMEAEESNKYNLTQDLAEKFGVYCKYVYEHDENYRITARRVIFYNNFIEEGKGPIDITYKYHTSSISREMDCTDLVTKMYIKAIDDDLSESGKITIMDVDANKSKEDYLLNFDYVHTIGAIDDEAYNYIEKYEKEIRELNNQIIPLQDKLITLESKLPEEEAKLTIYSNSIVKAQEIRDESQAYIDSLVGKDGVIPITEGKPEQLYIRNLNGVRYIDITEKGIKVSSFKLYKDYNSTAAANQKLTNQIKIGKIEYDEVGNMIKATNLSGYGSSNFCYAIYEYSPKIYHQAVIDTQQIIIDDNTDKKKKQEQLINNIETQIENCQKSIQTKQDQKDELIKDFELLMGPALREGYWQPEDYDDYGDRYVDNFTLDNETKEISGTTPLASFIWDTELFEDEQKVYYEIGAEQQKQYYPGFVLTGVYGYQGKINWDNLGFLYYDNSTNHPNDPVYKKAFIAGSRAKLVFLRDLREEEGYYNKIWPVLLLTGFKDLPATEQAIIGNASKSGSDPYGRKIGSLTRKVDSSGNIYTQEVDYFNPTDAYIPPEWMKDKFQLVVPRIKLSSLAVKHSEDQLAIKYNNNMLEEYEDYSVLTRTNGGEDEIGYYITLDPGRMMREGLVNNQKLDILYTLSNANVSIYLDAIEVIKDSSQPQVSYSVDVAAVQKDYIRQVHRMLNRIVHINDPELKFENVQGYVSEVTLNLDRPWEDSIEIKNYKTKFEDLFTKIVASTEAMKKQSYVAGIVSNAFSADGSIQANAMQSALNNLQTLYKNGNTTFSIDPAHGIIFQNSEGILALRDGGLFGATQKVINYSTTSDPTPFLQLTTDWDWKTFVTPAGINLKNTINGQIDTNNVSIFAGDKKRFQLNADGLFAYKQTDNTNSIDEKQYVVLNSEGLFHVENGVNRVEVSWGGFKLRNKSGVPVFYANSTSGDLTIAGEIYAKSGWIGNTTANNGWYIGTDSNGWGFIGTDSDKDKATMGFRNVPWNNPDLNSNIALWIGGDIGQPDNGIEIAPFYVSKDGTMHASGAIIEGTITATDGQVGGWTVGSNYLGNANTLANSTIGFHINTGDNVVLWAGNTRAKAPFRVTANGKLTASDVSITGGSLDVNNGKFKVTPEGVLTAKEANITGTITANTVNALGIIDDAFKWQKVSGIQYASADNLQYGKLGSLIFLRGSFTYEVQDDNLGVIFGEGLPIAKSNNPSYMNFALTFTGYWTNIADLNMNGTIYCQLWNRGNTAYIYVDDIRREDGTRLKKSSQGGADHIYCYFNTFYNSI